MDVGFKSFVTEDQIEQKKRIRQEEWELKRRPDQPLECPEEAEADYRTLYERLKEQKDKKQEEFEESKKLKHCIKVLDNDEVEFLEKVDEQKLKEIKDKLIEEKFAIEEFKKRVANLTEAEQNKKLNDFKKSLFSKPSNYETPNTNQLARSTTRRQVKLLQNAVKRKASEKDSGDEGPLKRNKQEDSDKNEKSKDDGEDKKNDDQKNEQKDSASSSVEIEEPKPAHKVLGILPGLASYASDSSEDDSDNDDKTQINSSELAPFLASGLEKQMNDLKKTLKKLHNKSV